MAQSEISLRQIDNRVDQTDNSNLTSDNKKLENALTFSQFARKIVIYTTVGFGVKHFLFRSKANLTCIYPLIFLVDTIIKKAICIFFGDERASVQDSKMNFQKVFSHLLSTCRFTNAIITIIAFEKLRISQSIIHTALLMTPFFLTYRALHDKHNQTK